MKIGVCANYTQAECIKNLGYDYIEEHFYRLSIYSEEEFQKAKETYKNVGIEVYSTNCFFPPSVNLYAEDIFEQMEKYVEPTLKRAVELGVKVCVFGSGGSRKTPEGMSKEEATNHLLKVFGYCADICAKYGVTLAVEPLNFNETDMFVTVEEASEFARKMNKKNFGTIVDFFHVFMNGESLDSVRKAKGVLVHAHLARPNADRKIPNEGDAKTLKEWRAVLDEIGYDGTISLECLFDGLEDFLRAKPLMNIFKKPKIELLDENTKLKVTEYKVLGELPDLFTFSDGSKVKTKEDWEKRRPELMETAVSLQYGDLPEPEFLEVETTYMSPTRNSYRITTGRRAHPVVFNLKLIHPAHYNCPVIVDGDLCFGYAYDKEYLAPALDNGIAWALFDRTELAHDICGEGKRQGQLYDAYPEYEFGAIRAWAWGYSRVVDALEIIKDFTDNSLIAFSGHSRGGKTCALAGVLDKRAVIVNPNETCAGACSCYRVHMKAIDEKGEEKRSETLKDLVNAFDFWMNPKLAEYSDDETKLPFDAHFMKALVAPRKLFISEAVHDIWGNPLGSYQTTMASKEVYKFLDAEENLLWYFRDGGHAHTPLDVKMLVNVILNVKNGEPLNENFFRRPFDDLEPIYKKYEK